MSIYLGKNRVSLPSVRAGSSSNVVESTIHPGYAANADTSIEALSANDNGETLSWEQVVAKYEDVKQSDLKDWALSADVNANFAKKTDLKDWALSSDIGDGKITINQGGQKKGEFNLNQKNAVTIDLAAGGSGDAVWGSITGTLSAQSDLKREFDRVDSAINGKVVWKNWD